MEIADLQRPRRRHRGRLAAAAPALGPPGRAARDLDGRRLRPARQRRVDHRRPVRGRGLRVDPRPAARRRPARDRATASTSSRGWSTTSCPPGVRIADADRVRLGAHLAEGTTVMHEGFVNYNAGTLGASMVEGRISAGVVVGDGSDIGGGASIMGTLSGGGTEVISIGERCLLGANAGIGISLGDDCVVEAGCYVTAGTKVTVSDMDGKPQVVKALDALRRQTTCCSGATRSPAPSRPCRGRATASRSTPTCTPTRPMGRRDRGRRSSGWRRVGIVAATGYGVLNHVAPLLEPEECTATVDGRTVELDHRAGRERRADRRDRRAPRPAGAGGLDRARHGVPGVEALQHRVRRPRLARPVPAAAVAGLGQPASRSSTRTTPPTRSTTRCARSTATRRCGSPRPRRRCSAPASPRRTPTTRPTPGCWPRRSPASPHAFSCVGRRRRRRRRPTRLDDAGLTRRADAVRREVEAAFGDLPLGGFAARRRPGRPHGGLRALRRPGDRHLRAPDQRRRTSSAAGRSRSTSSPRPTGSTSRPSSSTTGSGPPAPAPTTAGATTTRPQSLRRPGDPRAPRPRPRRRVRVIPGRACPGAPER